MFERSRVGEIGGAGSRGRGLGFPAAPTTWEVMMTSPDAVNPASGSGLERRSPASSRDNRVALRLIGLAVLGHMLRSRRFYERLTLAAIVLTALTRLSRENRDITLARLSAWNKRQVQLLERKAERQAKRLGRKVRTQG